VAVQEDKGHAVTLHEGASVEEIVRALNSIGASPRDIIAIFQAIKASGALQAELEIL
jgi:flagellar P-ring protein precursor FlgI